MVHGARRARRRRAGKRTHSFRMSSDAYKDYSQRLGDAVYLVRMALTARSPAHGVTLAKGAVVLAAAALERYIADVCNEFVTRLPEEWSSLSVGQQQYVVRAMADRLCNRGVVIQKTIPKNSAKGEAQLRAVVGELAE